MGLLVARHSAFANGPAEKSGKPSGDAASDVADEAEDATDAVKGKM